MKIVQPVPPNGQLSSDEGGGLFSKTSEPKREKGKPILVCVHSRNLFFGVAIEEEALEQGEKRLQFFFPQCWRRQSCQRLRLRGATNVMVILLHSAMHY